MGSWRNPYSMGSISSPIYSKFAGVTGHCSIDIILGQFNQKNTNCEIVHQVPVEKLKWLEMFNLIFSGLLQPNSTQDFSRWSKNQCFFTAKRNPGWWLNQPIWKICSSNWKSFPRFGVNIKKILSCHHLESWVATNIDSNPSWAKVLSLHCSRSVISQSMENSTKQGNTPPKFKN